MAKRARILVVDSDLHALSKIYLSLIHKDYRVEASDDAGEIPSRTERFKPRLLVLNAGSRNLTPAICEQLKKKRLPILLLNGEGVVLSLDERRVERLAQPLDLNYLDEKIREVLMLVD